MSSDTSEKALEACIERFLTGDVSTPASNDDKVQEEAVTYQAGNGVGYLRGQSSDFNAEFALDEAKFWQFLEATQADELAKLTYKPDYRRQILERLHRKLKKDGILSVLKKGLDVDNAHFDLLYRLPYNELSDTVKQRFESNVFSVSRQIYFSSVDQKSVDMVLFLNGLPIATLELKNPWTGQNVNHAKKQYREDRDPKETLFQFRRCLVHFAVDPDEVWMTTKLDGKSTYFLPFNKGHNHGKGNPPNPDGHKSAYLWQEILTRQSLTNIIEHYAKVTEEKDKKTGKVKKTLFFPRYHQLQVVRNLLTDVQDRGVGHRYLIQHSAGSGKSHSITWLGYQLVELYDKTGQVNLFDSVIVVTDRRVLDRQIDKNIKAFAEVKNLLAHADSSSDLKTHLENGKKLITTTIQKFPFIVDGIADMSGKNFAVIIDEAHSSQSGQAADKLNMSLGAAAPDGNSSDEDEEPEDYQDKILAAMAKRKMGQNASYFAFTATPKKATLEKFGTPNADGGFDPFHLYSMKQAIEEDFILDVLANYTTYKSYYEVQKSIEGNPEFDTAKAQKKLRAHVESHPDTIDTKAALMVDHFLSQVIATKKLRGQARGMVATRNIESAIRYYQAIKRELKRSKVNFQAIVAFSGKKTVDGIEHTEESLNGFPSKDLPDMFSGKYATENPRKPVPTYRLLVVANKYLTGFDEPLLHTMYVDKRLQGVLAVQALSRLNRCNVKMQKQDTFILDFYNTAQEIKDAFDPFYTATSLSEPTDVNVLHDLKDALDDAELYSSEDIERFNRLFFDGEDAEKLHPIIDECVDRFDQIEEEDDKIDLKIKAKQFVKLYGQLACIIPFENAAWEKLHWFLKFLIPKLQVNEREQDELDALLESVDLSTYGLERVHLNQGIGLDDSDTELEPENPNVRGFHDPLSEHRGEEDGIAHPERWRTSVGFFSIPKQNGFRSPIFIVETVAQRMRGWEKDGRPFRMLVDHGCSIPPEASRIHGYTQQILRNKGKRPHIVYEKFRKYVGGNLPIVSFNLSYDWNRALVPERERLNISPIRERGFCTMRLAQRVLDPSPAGNCKLQALRQYFGLRGGEAHTALGDVETTIDLLQKVLRPSLEERGFVVWDDLERYAEKKFYPSIIPFGKFNGRHIQDAKHDPDLRNWIEWVATESENKKSMGAWYLRKLGFPVPAKRKPESRAIQPTRFDDVQERRSQDRGRRQARSRRLGRRRKPESKRERRANRILVGCALSTFPLIGLLISAS